MKCGGVVFCVEGTWLGYTALEAVGGCHWVRREGALVGAKSKTKVLGLNFGQRNMEVFIFKQKKPHQGGVHCVLGRGGQQLGVA